MQVESSDKAASAGVCLIRRFVGGRGRRRGSFVANFAEIILAWERVQFR